MKLTFTFGVKWGHIGENRMTGKRVELPRGFTKLLKHAIQLTVTEFLTLMSKLGLLEKLTVAFAEQLGPHIIEAFGLQRPDMNLNQRIVSFRRVLSKDALRL
jgi:hypothetical protein